MLGRGEGEGNQEISLTGYRGVSRRFSALRGEKKRNRKLTLSLLKKRRKRGKELKL